MPYAFERLSLISSEVEISLYVQAAAGPASSVNTHFPPSKPGKRLQRHPPPILETAFSYRMFWLLEPEQRIEKVWGTLQTSTCVIFSYRVSPGLNFQEAMAMSRIHQQSSITQQERWLSIRCEQAARRTICLF